MHPNYLSEGFGQTVKRGRSSVSVTAYDTFDISVHSVSISFSNQIKYFKFELKGKNYDRFQQISTLQSECDICNFLTLTNVQIYLYQKFDTNESSKKYSWIYNNTSI